MSVQIKWEDVKQGCGSYLQRSKTPTGWLVREISDTLVTFINDKGPENGYAWTTAITFVPDPDHVWLKEEPYEHKVTG